jgi:hypothetical protein
MAIVFMMNEEIAHGMVCFFHQKKHSYLICYIFPCFGMLSQEKSGNLAVGLGPHFCNLRVAR